MDEPTITETLRAVRQAVILQALFDVAPCPDSPEPGRACRRCEAAAVAAALDGMEVPA